MENPSLLLAVDVGLRTGLALFAANGRLCWYRSHHLPTPQKLKRLISSLLRGAEAPAIIYLEGSGALADLWLREAERRSIPIVQLHAEQWRKEFFYARQRSSGIQAKKEAGILARQVITELGGKKPTSLRHDTAEAVLIGLYALRREGWLPADN
ncbi:MAG: hypothetical protein C0622_08495 [Desulfuromonas sp.]|nr:MAG: hypothetical protein C0622_08495 [Desulfuromonas sp.]